MHLNRVTIIISWSTLRLPSSYVFVGMKGYSLSGKTRFWEVVTLIVIPQPSVGMKAFFLPVSPDMIVFLRVLFHILCLLCFLSIKFFSYITVTVFF